MTLYARKYVSPCGDMLLVASETGLVLADWINDNSGEAFCEAVCDTRNLRYMMRRYPAATCVYDPASSILTHAARQLDEYFSGIRREFNIHLEFSGTEFQNHVWNELLTIPYGKTLSYGDIANRIGSPRAVRGVAAAIGANRMSVFIPCHRVIGSDGSLTGYAGGLYAKRFLLNLELPESMR